MPPIFSEKAANIINTYIFSHVICLKFHPRAQEGLATKLPLTKYAMFKYIRSCAITPTH